MLLLTTLPVYRGRLICLFISVSTKTENGLVSAILPEHCLAASLRRVRVTVL